MQRSALNEAPLFGSVVPLGEVRLQCRLLSLAVLVKVIYLAFYLPRILHPDLIALPVLLFLPRMSQHYASYFVLVIAILAVLFAVQRFMRFAGVALVLALTYVLLVDEQAYGNHLYLLILLTALVSLAGFSALEDRVSYWPFFLCKFQISVVYFYGGLSKINDVYLSGTILYGVWGETLFGRIPDTPETHILFSGLAALSIIFEVALAMALWFERWRKLATIMGIAFHATILLTFGPGERYNLIVFCFLMACGYRAFWIRPQEHRNK